MANWKFGLLPRNPRRQRFLPQRVFHIGFAPSHTQTRGLELGFSRRLSSEGFVILEPGSSLVKGHSFYGRGPVATFSLVVFVGAFILIPGGCGLVFSLGGAHLAPVALAFASLGAGFLPKKWHSRH